MRIWITINIYDGKQISPKMWWRIYENISTFSIISDNILNFSTQTHKPVDRRDEDTDPLYPFRCLKIPCLESLVCLAEVEGLVSDVMLTDL